MYLASYIEASFFEGRAYGIYMFHITCLNSNLKNTIGYTVRVIITLMTNLHHIATLRRNNLTNTNKLSGFVF